MYQQDTAASLTLHSVLFHFVAHGLALPVRLEFVIVNDVTDVRLVTALDTVREQAEHLSRRPSSISSASAKPDRDLLPAMQLHP